MTDKLSDAWQCQSCGCYFPHNPKILDNGVKRCSKCVEVEVLELERDRFVKANAEVARLNADLAVANIDLEQRVERLERRITERADMYEKDGEPGPLGYNQWGWMIIAEELRKVLAAEEEA